MDILKTHNPKTLSLLAVIFLGLSYICISLAIDSGNFLQWLTGIFFGGWALTEIIRAIRYSLHR